MQDLEKGAPAPDFTLPTDSGDAFTLSACRGRPVVIFFYPKDNTPGCTKEAIGFSALKSEFDALGAEVVGISPDSVKKHANFRAKHALTVRLAADKEKEAALAYGVWVEKSMYGRKYMGIDRSTFLVAADGTLAEVWRKVKVPGHAEAVLAATRDLG